jgi:hypothetical protein
MTRGKCLPNLFLWHDFRNFKEEKHLSSSTDPSTSTLPISANFTYSKMNLQRCLDKVSWCQSLTKEFTLNGGAQAASVLAFIVILKNPCCTSNFEDNNSRAMKGSPPSTKGFPLLTSMLVQ